MADDYVATHEGGWRNSKHRWQWTQTLTAYAAPIRDMPVDQVGADDVLAVLKPLWTRAPVTASRLRGRVEKVLDAARALGHIDPDRANPARWKGHLELLLPKPKKLTRGHHRSLPYANVPALMTRLAEIDSAPSKALQITILSCARTSEALGMTFKEIDFENAIWTIPASRMKMGKAHDVPLSDQALAILKVQYDERGENPHVFPGRPQRGLSNMSLAMLMRRLGIDATVHGFRASARSWMADQGVSFDLAEAVLAHSVGNQNVAAYQRSSLLERRRPVMIAWADFIGPASNVVSIKRGAA